MSVRPVRASYAPAIKVLAGLAAGIVLGIAASRTAAPPLVGVVSVLEPIGVVFVNAIRMAVVPLVVASLIAGLVSMTDARALAVLGVRSLALFAGLALTVAVFATAIAAPLLARLDIDPAAAAALRQSMPADVPAAATPRLGQWLSDLVPANPIKAAADGAMLPLIVFTLAFGMALTKVVPDRRAAVVGFFVGLADAMMVLVGWVISFAPYGVFALTAPLAARMGISAAGALLSYVALAALLTLASLAVVVYPITAFLSGISMRRLARAFAPAQALAFSSRSTLASLPAMISAAKALGVPEYMVAFVVPFAASIFRVGAAVGQTVAVLFAARLFDVNLSPFQLAAILLTTVLTTFTVPGIPGGSIVVMVPILVAANVPADAVGLLLGVDVIPDMFRTAANATGGMAAATILGRSALQQESAAMVEVLPTPRG